jgi:cell division protease FtsH
MNKLLKRFSFQLPKIKNLNFFNNNNNHFKLGILFIVLYFIGEAFLSPDKVTFEFVDNKIKEGSTVSLELAKYDTVSKDFFATINKKIYYFPMYLTDVQDYTKKLKDQKVQVPSEEISYVRKLRLNNFTPILFWISIFFFCLAIKDYFFRVSRSMSMGADIQKEKVNVKFSEICGIDNIKSELTEVVKHFLNSDRVRAMGGKTLKGVMLYGPPGTGKTLMAKAVASETKANFIAISGSQFVEMYVGLGAKRMRDLFNKARESKPCVIFIDEIDAFALKRGSERSHSEYDQTVNEMLAQMDGFKNNDGILVIAATNRIDNIDEALIRPGRFDRKIKVDLPSVKGRKEILSLYIDKCPKKSVDINLDVLAKATTSFSGADLKNLVDESIYIAIQNNHEEVNMDDFMKAKDKIQMGVVRDIKLSDNDKRLTAYHEIGHAIISYLKKVGEVSQISIVPRGSALGVTQMIDDEKFSLSKEELTNRLRMFMGGKAAEKVFCQHRSTGASDDLKRASALARRMVCEWGMGSLGPVNVNYGTNEYAVLSEQLKYQIDSEVIKLLTQAESETEDLLIENKELVEQLSQKLIENENMNSDEFIKICNQFKNKE